MLEVFMFLVLKDTGETKQGPVFHFFNFSSNLPLFGQQSVKLKKKTTYSTVLSGRDPKTFGPTHTEELHEELKKKSTGSKFSYQHLKQN